MTLPLLNLNFGGKGKITKHVLECRERIAEGCNV